MQIYHAWILWVITCHSHVKPWHTSTCVNVPICVAGAISPGISVQWCVLFEWIQHRHKHANENDYFFRVNRKKLPMLMWKKKLSFKDALNARTQAVSCQSHNSPLIWDLASVKGPRCNMKEKTSNVKHVCKRTYLLIVNFSTTHVDKNAPSLTWIIFPNLLRFKKKLPAFTLCSDRLSQQSARFDQNKLPVIKAGNEKICLLGLISEKQASNGTYVTSKQIWIAKEILQCSHQMSDWMILWSVLR